jgi:hypothetical protein
MNTKHNTEEYESTIHAIGRQNQPIQKKFTNPLRNHSYFNNKHYKDQYISNRCQQCSKPTHKDPMQCQAIGKKCNKCQKLNHFANCCRNSTINVINEEQHYQMDGDNNENQTFYNQISEPGQFLG